MSRLRISIIGLAIWFVILFNIERPDVNGIPYINLASVAYVMAALIAGLTFLLPTIHRLPLPLLYGALLIYLPIKALFGYQLGGADLPYTIIELVALVITGTICRSIAEGLQEFEQAIEDVVLEADNTRILPTTEGIDRINDELQRSRRYDRPVSLLYCEVDPATVEANLLMAVEEVAMTLKRRYVQVSISKTLDAALYNTDIISVADNGFVMCLPETNRSAAEAIGQRLQTLVAERHNLRLNLGVASFSEENLTYQGLLSEAREDYWNHVQYLAEGEVAPGETALGPMRLFDARYDEMAWVNALPRQTEATRLIYRVVKRVFDLTVTLAVLPVALPLMALIAFLITIDSGAPIFFIQDRTGMGGRRFKMYKFRTMVPDAEQLLDTVAETNIKGELAGPVKLKNDPRVTRMGRILRRTSLDELPQLLNVLRGEMSLVGPRPTSWSLASYQLWQTERLNVRPGITGLWQVCDRGDTSFDEWLRWDIKYIERMSFWLDLQIILRTAGNVLARKGAH